MVSDQVGPQLKKFVHSIKIMIIFIDFRRAYDSLKMEKITEELKTY